MPIQTEQISQVTKLLVLTDGGTGNAVMSGAHAIAATTINVASGGANFVNGDAFRVGSGEDQTVYVATGSTATTITIAAPGLKRAYADGTPVVEQVQDQYGPVTDAGVKLAFSRESTKQFSGQQRLTFAILKGYGAVRAEGVFDAYTLFNVALAAGATRSKVLGAGSVADPYAFINAGNDFGVNTNVNVIVEGLLSDGVSPIRAELYGVRFDYTSLAMQFARGVLSGVPFKLLAGASAVIDYSASPWTGTTTYNATNANVLDGLDDFGYFAAHGTPLNVTVSSGGAVGTNSVTVSSGTGYAQGDWVKYGSGNTVEFHQVQSVATNTLTNRTRFLRSQAAGTAVQRQQLVQMVAITKDGVKLNIGGTMTEVYSGIRDFALDLRPGNAFATYGFALTSYSKTTFALALGKAIPGGNVLNLIDGMGRTPVDGLYATGLMQGGRRLWINAWGVDVDLSAVEAVFSNQGEPPAIPFAGEALSGIQLVDSA